MAAIVKPKPQFLDVPTHVADGAKHVAVPKEGAGPAIGPQYHPEVEARK